MAQRPHYEVIAIRYGTLLTQMSSVYLNFQLYGEPDEEIRMDYFVWVIRNADRTILVDSGFNAAAGARRGRELLVPVVDALRRIGIQVDDIDTLVVSHAHYDHIGNLSAFPRTPVVASRRELDFWSGPYAGKWQFATSVEPEELSTLAAADSDGRITAVDDRLVIAPDIEVIDVGGHTPGQLITVVGLESGRVVIASDAVHFYDEIERDRPFVHMADLVDTYRTYDLLKELTAEEGQIFIPGHDPAVMDRFPDYPGHAGVAVRIA